MAMASDSERSKEALVFASLSVVYMSPLKSRGEQSTLAYSMHPRVLGQSLKANFEDLLRKFVIECDKNEICLQSHFLGKAGEDKLSDMETSIKYMSQFLTSGGNKGDYALELKYFREMSRLFRQANASDLEGLERLRARMLVFQDLANSNFRKYSSYCKNSEDEKAKDDLNQFFITEIIEYKKMIRDIKFAAEPYGGAGVPLDSI